jgi:phosphoribosylformimino-5-aminoimidazole carboxamide ribotide isomerase
MIVYPAIDLRNGQVVRLQEGDPNRQTTFSGDPIATAEKWLSQGATWLHVVNLDGAFGTDSPNLSIVAQLAKLTNVQFGGGLRSAQHIQQAIDLGVARVVLGTIAIQQPQIVLDALHQYGAERVCVGLDARDDKITTHGWQTVSDLTPVALGKEMAKNGVIHALYTDVSRDGKLTGVNVNDTVSLAENTNLRVIASGGVGNLDDIRALHATGKVAGAIVGMALYTNQFTLTDALKITG